MTFADVDIIVAGGGPVGLAAGIEARLMGLSAVVLEPRALPIDKACGEGLMPAAVRSLLRLGITPIGQPFRGIRYLDARRCVEHRFRGQPGVGVRRPVLHAALAARAEALGVQVVRRRVGEVGQDTERVHAAGLHGRWLLACDGLHSPIRRSLGLDAAGDGVRRYGLRRHFSVRPWSDLVEVYWGADHEAYVTPIGTDLIGVALLGPPGRSYTQSLAAIPVLSDRLARAFPASEVLGAGPLRQSATLRVAGRVLLVGDAAGYVDALTGEGLAVGLAQAREAVRAISRGHPESYEQAWRAVTRRYRLLTAALLAAATRPHLRRLVVPAATGMPAVFGRAVEVLAT